MDLAGKTSENQIVLNGVGTLCFTSGVPLEIVLGYFKDKGLVIDWLDYIKTALLDGHNPRTIRARIESATSDIYGGVYSKEVVSRANIILNWLTNPEPESMIHK